MGHHKEPETATLTVGYLLLGLSLPALLLAVPSVLLALFSNWSLFAMLQDQDRLAASLLFGALAGAAVMALITGVRAISATYVEDHPPSRGVRPLTHMRRTS